MTTPEDIEQNRFRARVTVRNVSPGSRFAVVANRQRATALARDLLEGRVTLHGPVPTETVQCLAQAVLDFDDEIEGPIDVFETLTLATMREVDRIVEALLTGTAAASYPPIQHPTSISFSGYHEAMSHVRWMLDALATNEALRTDPMKAWRWIGSVFGILIGLGYMTIDDARRFVTEARL